ncbi:MAG: hypothetical protein KA171_25025, partial [Reyranella sp.]|nr:hypothetical protein [Reyranella sp.]
MVAIDRIRWSRWIGSPGHDPPDSPVAITRSGQPDVARRRWWWRRLQQTLEPERLVFIDETWTKTNMTRTRGWWR